MATSRTKRSTPPQSEPKLSEVARHVVIPSGIVTTGWPAVEAKCRELFGVKFDRWQDDLGRVVLGKRSDGLYAATIGGIWLAIPRQVAKTWFVLRVLFALCILFPGMKVLWTAHHGQTLSNTFRAASGLARRKKVDPYIGNPDGGSGVLRGTAKEAILFKNGSAIYFGSRDQGFGRGFEEVDIEVFDECQILNEKALDDMVAATNQSRHPHGALLFYMGTPPRPTDPGEVFITRRADAISGESEDTVYVECSADPGADPDDRKQWAKANPSFPKRTPLASMLRLRKNLVSVESWLREALGIWDENVSASKFFDLSKYDAALDTDAALPDGAAVVFTLDVSWSRDLAHLSMAGFLPDGKPFVRKILHAPPWKLIPLLKPRVEKWQPHAIALQGGTGSPANGLQLDLEKAGYEVRTLTGTEVAASFSRMKDLLADGAMSHPDEPDIRAAVDHLVMRRVVDSHLPDRMKSPVDIAGLISQAEALWLLEDVVGIADYDLMQSVH